MRLLRIEGDYVAVYEGRKRLALFIGAKGLDVDSAEQLRRSHLSEPETTENSPNNSPTEQLVTPEPA